jgi:hypothetical protein
MTTRINRCLLLAFGLACPIKLIPHITNSHRDVKLNWILPIYLIIVHLIFVAFFNIFYAISFHGYPEIPWPLYLFSRHMSTSISCIIPFMSYLERLFFILSHPNISTIFHQSTYCIALLHRGNSSWLTFTRFSYLYWMPSGDTFGVG